MCPETTRKMIEYYRFLVVGAQEFQTKARASAGLRGLFRNDWLGRHEALPEAIAEAIVLSGSPSPVKETSSLGGTAKAAKLKPLKALVIELLRSKAPDGGWETAADAARSLEGDVEALAQEIRITPSKSNIRSLIEQWCGPNREPEIHKAFYDNCSSKCREKIDRKRTQLQ